MILWGKMCFPDMKTQCYGADPHTQDHLQSTQAAASQ